MKIAQTLLINWICLLCLMGGFINTVSFLKYSFTISHFTGNATRIAIDIANHDMSIALKLFLIILAFTVGATLAGYILDGRDFNLKKRYGYIFLILGSFLLFLYCFARNSELFFYYLPFMMGVQNGLFITYKGVVLRTSHITGTITDAGVYLGHILKGRFDELWKLRLCFSLVIMFLLGGYIGIKLFMALKDEVFIIIAFNYIIIAAIYFNFRERHLKILALKEHESPFK